jgi:hypothetical protein
VVQTSDAYIPRTASVAGGGMPAREEEAVLPGVAADHADRAGSPAALLRFAVVRNGVVGRSQAPSVVLPAC